MIGIKEWLKVNDWGFPLIETDEEGESQLSDLRRNIASSVFNEWEQNFIRDMIGKRYATLTKNQKAVVTRLYDWLRGEPK